VTLIIVEEFGSAYGLEGVENALIQYPLGPSGVVPLLDDGAPVDWDFGTETEAERAVLEAVRDALKNIGTALGIMAVADPPPPEEKP
jgi:hypothetical protein